MPPEREKCYPKSLWGMRAQGHIRFERKWARRRVLGGLDHDGEDPVGDLKARFADEGAQQGGEF